MNRVISVDHGNRLTKTQNHVFPSSYIESCNLPAIGGDVLCYQGKEYTLTSQCMHQLNDKTTDERYFILNLFAIGKELSKDVNLLRQFAPSNTINVELVFGLPLQHFKLYSEKYKPYFMNNGKPISFTLNNRPYTVLIESAYAYPQAFAAAVTILGQLKGSKMVNIVDIGGFTVDCLQLENLKPNMKLCVSLYSGVNTLFQHINNLVRSKGLNDIPESIIEGILQGDVSTLTESSKERIEIVRSGADSHVARVLVDVEQKGFDLYESKTVFVGGGSMLLKNHITNAKKVAKPYFVDDVYANVYGFMLMHDSKKRSLSA